MNIIYRLVNRKKEKNNEFPCYYVGSKLNYVEGKYWGSSKHPLLIKELKENISDFEIEILEKTTPDNLTLRERYWQLNLDVLNDEKYYNLSLANERFSSTGFTWFHDPITLANGYFPRSKCPQGWELGKTPETAKRTINRQNRKTGLKKTDPLLHQQISDTISNTEWIIQDPNGIRHTVTKLHKFCKENNISQKLRLTKKFGIPIKKGKSKGWCVISKKTIGT